MKQVVIDFWTCNPFDTIPLYTKMREVTFIIGKLLLLSAVVHKQLAAFSLNNVNNIALKILQNLFLMRKCYAHKCNIGELRLSQHRHRKHNILFKFCLWKQLHWLLKPNSDILIENVFTDRLHVTTVYCERKWHQQYKTNCTPLYLFLMNRQ